jgi:hypothetical protein
VTALQVAQKFVERINAADVAGLAALMTEDHRFIDSLGNVVSGREAMKSGWAGYFSMVPDYRLTAQQWLCDGQVVVMRNGKRHLQSGRLAPTRAPLDDAGGWPRDGPWGSGRRVARVYADNEPIRQLMRANS